MIRAAVLGMACTLAVMGAQPAAACATLTPDGLKRKTEQDRRWLNRHSDMVVTGTWHIEEDRAAESNYRMVGYVEVVSRKKVKRYRLSIPGDINCGFPFYFLQNGDTGRFYLKRKASDHEGTEFVENFDYVHFAAAKGDE
ncbi:MAG: hypothetical protein Q7T68_15120 [Sphingopyxis sp.]|nr:hypothetical protein [Sphingopyxis sp.]